MKRVIITFTLLIVAVGTFYMLKDKPNSTVKLPITDEHLHEKKPFTSQKHSIKPKDETEEHVHITENNSAAKLDNLPKEIQDEIKQLSGRYNNNVQPIEVEPGVFLIPAGKGVNVVPVAVINDDGTISTHEY